MSETDLDTQPPRPAPETEETATTPWESMDSEEPVKGARAGKGGKAAKAAEPAVHVSLPADAVDPGARASNKASPFASTAITAVGAEMAQLAAELQAILAKDRFNPFDAMISSPLDKADNHLLAKAFLTDDKVQVFEDAFANPADPLAALPEAVDPPLLAPEAQPQAIYDTPWATIGESPVELEMEADDGEVEDVALAAEVVPAEHRVVESAPAEQEAKPMPLGSRSPVLGGESKGAEPDGETRSSALDPPPQPSPPSTGEREQEHATAFSEQGVEADGETRSSALDPSPQTSAPSTGEKEQNPAATFSEQGVEPDGEMGSSALDPSPLLSPPSTGEMEQDAAPTFSEQAIVEPVASGAAADSVEVERMEIAEIPAIGEALPVFSDVKASDDSAADERVGGILQSAMPSEAEESIAETTPTIDLTAPAPSAPAQQQETEIHADSAAADEVVPVLDERVEEGAGALPESASAEETTVAVALTVPVAADVGETGSFAASVEEGSSESGAESRVWVVDDEQEYAATVHEAATEAEIAADSEPEVDTDISPAPVATGGGWTIPLMCLGIGLVACCLAIPQIEASRQLRYEQANLKANLESVQKQVSVNDEFLKKVMDDPTLAQRLANRQMMMIPRGEKPLPMKEATAEESDMSPFAMMAVAPPPAPPPYMPIRGSIASLCQNAHTRLYLLGTAMTMVAVGLVMGCSSKK